MIQKLRSGSCEKRPFLQRAGITAGVHKYTLGDSNTVICVCIYVHKCMEFFMHVSSSATACVCKTIQTLVFPDQLVNHIWGKNLDSFPLSFSAAFPFPSV